MPDLISRERVTTPSEAPRLVRVEAAEAGQRIDNFLLRMVPGVPASHIHRVVRRGEVRVNKGRVKSSHRLSSGDLVRIPPLKAVPPRAPGQAPASWLERLEAAILYEDEMLIVIDKPAGLAVHGGSGLHYGLIESLRQLRPGRDLELVHRLDRETSGCLLISKRRSRLRELHALLREQGVDKRYLALLAGALPQREIDVRAPLRKNVERGGERFVRVDPVAGKPAHTRLRRQRTFVLDDLTLTLVEARPLTGRTHQIRVHAASLGAPLAGDAKYGDPAANRRLAGLGLERLFLHAARIGPADTTADWLPTVSAPLPADLQHVLTRLEATACPSN